MPERPGPPGHRQLVTSLSAGGGKPAFAISCSKDLERDTRATLMLVEKLFRFDVVVASDSLRTVVRKLGSGELEIRPRHHNEPGTNLAVGDGARYEPTRTGLDFTLRSHHETVAVSITIGAVRLASRGVTRISAQAIVRQVEP
ncbi:MAG: hypothetical protein ACLP0J_08620 [Solirubrobacteraceae bacterium]